MLAVSIPKKERYTFDRARDAVLWAYNNVNGYLKSLENASNSYEQKAGASIASRYLLDAYDYLMRIAPPHSREDDDTGALCQEIVSRVKEIKETRRPVEVANLLATGNWIVLSAISGFEEGKEYGFFALGRIR